MCSLTKKNAWGYPKLHLPFGSRPSWRKIIIIITKLSDMSNFDTSFRVFIPTTAKTLLSYKFKSTSQCRIRYTAIITITRALILIDIPLRQQQEKGIFLCLACPRHIDFLHLQDYEYTPGTIGYIEWGRNTANTIT